MNTLEETYFAFTEAVLTSEIEFTVLDYVSASIYYWKLRLFGCKEVNGKYALYFSVLLSIYCITANKL